MAHLDRLQEPLRSFVAGLPCTNYPTTPWVSGPPLSLRKIALISTAGVHLAHDRPFQPDEGSYREIPGDSRAEDLVMSHVSSNFDRGGFRQDWNVVFPIDRLREFAAAGTVGSLSSSHYSFMGATEPAAMELAARDLAGRLARTGVDAALLVPV